MSGLKKLLYHEGVCNRKVSGGNKETKGETERFSKSQRVFIMTPELRETLKETTKEFLGWGRDKLGVWD